MYDPKHGLYQRAKAESALGIDEETRDQIMTAVKLDLLLAHAGITDDKIELAYDATLKNQLADVRDAFEALVGKDEDLDEI